MKHVKAKKYFGQHFLNNTKIAFSITDLIDPYTNHVVEIGPGMGMLTQFLIKKKYTTQVIEIDTESVSYLKNKYPNLNIFEGDFLQIDLKKIFPDNFSLIGNFPYNISSQILFKILENKDQITEVIGMFQKEVAERIVCKKGKKRGILSVFLQAFYNIEYCFTVSPTMFIPPPKVQSAVIKLKRNKRINLTIDEKKFKKVVKTAFNKKRKTLRNNLRPFTLVSQKEIEYLLTLRAEQLSVEDFIKITKSVK